VERHSASVPKRFEEPTTEASAPAHGLLIR